MRPFLLLFLVILTPLFAAQKAQKFIPDADQLARTAAVTLIEQGRVSEAVAYLGANLRLDSGPDARTIAVTQALIAISFDFLSQRQLLTARTVAKEAVAQAAPLVKNPRGDAVTAAVFVALGQLCEEALFDLSA